jgi:hypothetical protein
MWGATRREILSKRDGPPDTRPRRLDGYAVAGFRELTRDSLLLQEIIHALGRVPFQVRQDVRIGVHGQADLAVA